MHVLLISPVSQLPTIISQDSIEYAQLSFMGYTPIQTGTKKELQEVERELLEGFVQELEMNDIN